MTEWKVAGFVDTLAAAYAEAGDFEHAVEFATKAAEKSPDDEKKDVLARLETYQAKKSFREKPKGK